MSKRGREGEERKHVKFGAASNGQQTTYAKSYNGPASLGPKGEREWPANGYGGFTPGEEAQLWSTNDETKAAKLAAAKNGNTFFGVNRIGFGMKRAAKYANPTNDAAVAENEYKARDELGSKSPTYGDAVNSEMEGGASRRRGRMHRRTHGRTHGRTHRRTHRKSRRNRS